MVSTQHIQAAFNVLSRLYLYIICVCVHVCLTIIIEEKEAMSLKGKERFRGSKEMMELYFN